MPTKSVRCSRASRFHLTVHTLHLGGTGQKFTTPTDHRHVALHFDEINNRANVWINGKKIADAKDVSRSVSEI